ncbi:tRNA-dihydrouridine synthase [Cupriavidus gilardii]|uniref:oxidoreductase n=1 Tax=Cupriavidus gilardii TaxID=82541 RepID=UPI0015746A33|nr:NADH:flavin oxidoreductase [Cupriavidus gilardii]NSX04392.1 NADH:flavin oxidoreductase [Cupriavidus gilardii]
MNAPARPTLFDPGDLGGMAVPNRLVVAPMTRISATPEGVPTPTMVDYYAGFARGGFGLVITEGTYTDRAFSQGYAGQPGLIDSEQARAWRTVTDAVHDAGGRIFVQLMHAGALSQANRFRDETVGPSAITPKGMQMAVYRGEGPYRTPRAIEPHEIDAAIAGFAQAARLARDVAGFDGIEIHGANGYLLDQFLTDYTNRRDDAWGGPIGNRVRLAEQTARAVRAAVGDGFPVGIRISQGKVNDFTHKWAEAADGAAIVFGMLAATGIDFIHVTEFEAWQHAFSGDERTLVQHARLAAPHLTVIANGSLHDPARAHDALADGADLVALGRGALANPDWPMHVAKGIAPRAFDPALLSPFGEIKPAELRMREALPLVA